MRPDRDMDLPLGRDEEAADWCMRLSEGELTLGEQAKFDTWIVSSENKAAFDDAIVVWRAVDLSADQPEMLQVRSEALDDLRLHNGRRWRGAGRSRWMPRLAIAGALVAVVGLIVSVLLSGAQTLSTGIGERQVAVLSDGSKVSLDASSSVNVVLGRGARELTLVAGRAKFDVAKDPLRPFSVRAGNRLIVATGTSFSVELIGGEVRVQLYEGHVETYAVDNDAASRSMLKLSGQNQNASTALVPGSELIMPITATSATLHAIDAPRALSWEAGQLNFEGEPLVSAIERMNRYTDRKLRIDDAALAHVRIDGVFEAGDTAAFVEGLTELYGIRARESGNQIVLRNAP